MSKGEQELIGLKTYKEEATQNKNVNAETKQTKNQGFWAMASHTLEQVCVRRIKPTWASQIMRMHILTQKT